MADVKFGDMNWEREKLWCHGGKETLFTERRQREREREWRLELLIPSQKGQHQEIQKTRILKTVGDKMSLTHKGRYNVSSRPVHRNLAGQERVT